jgi:adenylylsulfate kinase
MAICDFVCPLPEMREIFDADVVVWMDTIKEGRFKNTNQIFVEPEEYDLRFTSWNSINVDVVLEYLEDGFISNKQDKRLICLNKVIPR